MLDRGLAVYVHWPFCETICPYCDFNVHLAGEIDDTAWSDALSADLAHVAADMPGRTVHSIYFGGGTPALMPAKTAGAVMDSISKHWSIGDDVEITLECNPTAAERARLAAFRAAGVNRLSVGVQSFDDAVLRFLGRDHSGAESLVTVDDAQATFDRVTLDLMYGLAEQTPDAWRAQLDRALTLGPMHLSLYQLTIEHGTPFFKRNVPIADPDMAADLYDLTQDLTSEAGLPSYEVSNHAQPGEESRHNLWCWRGGDYVGVGPGAHGRLTIDGVALATHQIHNPARWLEKTVTEGHGTAKRRHLSAGDRAKERLMMGLRLTEGVDVERTGIKTVIDPMAKQQLIDGGLLNEVGSVLHTTASGRLTLNSVIAALLND